jgi:cell division protein FtsZ
MPNRRDDDLRFANKLHGHRQGVPETSALLGVENKMLQLIESDAPNAVIKVVGVGGGGGNAVAAMMVANLEGVDFIVANTDAQALRKTGVPNVLQLGNGVTKGLGAGSNPEVGRQAALEDRERITEALKGADMVFITAGMGGGTGTGAAPIVAQIAKDMGILTVAVVTRPFVFEGTKRQSMAQKGIEELTQHVDSLITIPNEKLLNVMGRDVSLLNAFKEANKVLLGAVQGISELITRPGLVNVDFADVKTVMSEMGLAMMGTGQAKGDDRAVAATEIAIGNPLLEDVNLKGACGILVNITAGHTLSLREYYDVGRIIGEFASDDATIKIGTALDPDLQDEVRVTVVATGLNRLGGSNNVRDARGARSNMRMVATGYDAPIAAPASTRSYGQAAVGAANPALQTAPATAQHRSRSVENTADLRSEKNLDYLNIPAFLRRQAD